MGWKEGRKGKKKGRKDGRYKWKEDRKEWRVGRKGREKKGRMELSLNHIFNISTVVSNYDFGVV